MGRPRALTHPARTHTHSHTVSHPHARSHSAVIHQSKSTHQGQTPPRPPQPTPSRPRLPALRGCCQQRTVSKVESARRRERAGGCEGWPGWGVGETWFTVRPAGSDTL